MRTGNHDANDLPVTLLGGGSAGIAGGRVLDWRASSEQQRCRLYLFLTAKMGVELPGFGDATAPLAEI